MARTPNPIRPTLLHISIPEDVRKKLDNHLQGADGTIPRGSYQKFFVELINRFIREKK